MVLESKKTVTENWNRRNVNWYTLRSFGQSKVAGFSIAAPFVGYIILYHEKFRPYIGGLGGLIEPDALQASDASVQCAPWINFMDRLHLVYLGLFFLGVGTLIYRTMAHLVIQKNDSISEYVEREQPFVTARNLRSMFVTIKSRRPTLGPEFLERAPWLDRAKVDLKPASEIFDQNSNNSVVQDILRSYYNVLDRHTNRFWIWLTAGLFGGGFLLLGIPSVAFTARVTCAIFS